MELVDDTADCAGGRQAGMKMPPSGAVAVLVGYYKDVAPSGARSSENQPHGKLECLAPLEDADDC